MKMLMVPTELSLRMTIILLYALYSRPSLTRARSEEGRLFSQANSRATIMFVITKYTFEKLRKHKQQANVVHISQVFKSAS